MKSKLPCAVVRDLLPSYVEGLTEEETRNLVEEHLNECKDCAERCAAMKEPEQEQNAEELRKVDYLKTVRRRNVKRVVLAVVLACAVLCVGVWGKLFVIGSPLGHDGFYYEAALSEDGKNLHIAAHMLGSATVFSGTREDYSDKQVVIEARQAIASFINRRGTQEWDVAVQPGQPFCVNALGNVVYQDGLLIDQTTNRQFRSRTPYIGSMSRVAGVAQWLPLPAKSYTNRLHTDKEPYGWTLDFKEELDAGDRQKMEKSAVLALALVDNMGVVYWTEPGGEQGALTLEEANAQLKDRTDAYNQAHGTSWTAYESVKDYAESPYTLQQLKQIFEIQ